MPLTRKQKNFIKENFGKLSLEQVAAQLSLEPVQISAYLRQKNLNQTAPPPSDAIKEEDLSLRGFFQKNKGKILLLVLAAIVIYLNTLGNGFVSDDRDLPLDYKNQAYFQKIFTPQAAYRIPEIFHYLDSLGGFTPWRYHLTNILLHAAATLLVYFFLSYRLSPLVAFLASFLFAVHPLHTDAVSWVVSRSYLLFTIFALLSFIFYLQSTQERDGTVKDRKKYLFSLLFYLFAFESRWAEPVIFPVLLFIYDFCFRQIRKTWKLLCPYLLIDLAYPFLLLKVIQQRVVETSTSLSGNLEVSNLAVQIPIALTTYLKLFLFPLNLTFYHEDLSVGYGGLLAAWLVLITYLGALIYFFFKNRTLFFFLALFLLSLLYTFTPLKIAWAIAERYAYFGSLGLAAVFAYVFVNATKNTTAKTLLLVVFANLLLLYSSRTVLRNFDWQSEDTLWVATVKTSPGSSKAWNNIGDYYGRQGDLNASLNAFLRATQLNPIYADAWHNVGNTLMQMGKDEEALTYFEKARQFNPNIFQTYNNLALIKMKKGNFLEAEKDLRASLKLNPQEPRTFTLLGVLYFNAGNAAAAEEAFRQALTIDPSFTPAQENLEKLKMRKTIN